MTYAEIKKTYPRLFKKYPETSNLYTGNEDEKPIMYTMRHYTKSGSRWKLTEEEKTACSYITYYNIVDPAASAFFKNLGGYERTECNYTKCGFIPVKCVSISPDRTEKTERTFTF